MVDNWKGALKPYAFILAANYLKPLVEVELNRREILLAEYNKNLSKEG